MKIKSIYFATMLSLIIFGSALSGQGKHDNYKVSVYTRAYEVQKMGDPHWLDSTWQVISSQMNVDKIYLETHRDLLIADKKTILAAKEFFKKRGIEVAGGITYTIDESNQYQTYCYTRPSYRQKAKEIAEYTASLFDEFILDDFFFTNCKCDSCVMAKGDRSWADYRLELMTEAATNLIVGPAKKINPKVKVIIKYPNWYDHFQELGFNLETEPAIFDGIYTGTETRDAVRSAQHLQPYLGYLIFRYFENISPGRNGGGWVDPGGMRYYDRYAEQLWLTLFAKAPEMTFFDYRQLLTPLRPEWEPEWKDQETSFDYRGFLPVKKDATIAALAEHSLEAADKVVGKLGVPYGLKSYKPYHSTGEDFLQNYLGMIGIPVDMVPEFPMDDQLVLLTEQAKYDPDIVNKIHQRLVNGKDVIITSGLLNALQDRGIRNIVNLEYTSRKSYVSEFLIWGQIIKSETTVLIPQIQYSTNDSWELISGMDGGLGWPLLHQAKFGNGVIYLLNVPENFADLYNLPDAVLNAIREVVCKNLGVMIRGGSMVSVFLYDNNTIILESFNDKPVDLELVLSQKLEQVTDLISGEKLSLQVIPEFRMRNRQIYPERYSCKLHIPPHSFRLVRTGE
jgi:hypothetical protein